ncbi:hypothetical protein [Arsenicicoccus bolidensis]|uniref:hypothetical protein n=1 Tax=Arsenicicoccus bolidensis TaxID=229480 RepID=UPI0004926E45|nr:hypothetical protein [Arsenicicoccus bolidensis]
MTSNAVQNSSQQSGPSRKVLGATVVIATIVILGLVLTLTNMLGGKPDTPAAPPSPTAPPPPTTAAAAGSVCGLKQVQTSGTVASPPVATWTLVGTTAAPAIEGQGPGKIDEDGYRSCYARTPTGALVAAANLLAMGSQAALLGQKMTERSTVPGPGRDAALNQPPASADSSGVRIQIAGYRVLKYDGLSAEIDVAMRTSNGAVAAQALTLRWVDGDWKIQLAPTGDLPAPMTQLPSLAGYIMWSGA